MTDNGHAALATAIHVGRNHQHDPRADERPHAHLISEREQEEAAAILGERGVFLPEGLGPVMVGMAKEIATLRDALEEITKTRPASWNWADSDEMDRAIRIARSALVAAKETP